MKKPIDPNLNNNGSGDLFSITGNEKSAMQKAEEFKVIEKDEQKAMKKQQIADKHP